MKEKLYTVKSEHSDNLDSNPDSYDYSGPYITNCPVEAESFLNNYVSITGEYAWIEELEQ